MAPKRPAARMATPLRASKMARVTPGPARPPSTSVAAIPHPKRRRAVDDQRALSPVRDVASTSRVRELLASPTKQLVRKKQREAKGPAVELVIDPDVRTQPLPKDKNDKEYAPWPMEILSRAIVPQNKRKSTNAGGAKVIPTNKVRVTWKEFKDASLENTTRQSVNSKKGWATNVGIILKMSDPTLTHTTGAVPDTHVMPTDRSWCTNIIHVQRKIQQRVGMGKISGSTVTGYLTSMGVAAYVAGDTASWNFCEDLGMLYAHRTLSITNMQQFDRKEELNYVTPLQCIENAHALLQLCYVDLGMDVDRRPSQIKKEEFQYFWESMAVFLMITNGDFVIRPQTFEDCMIVRSVAEAEKRRSGPKKSKRYCVVPEDRDTNIQIVLYEWKTDGSNALNPPVPGQNEKYVVMNFTYRYITDAVRDSLEAYPRTFLMQDTGTAHSYSSAQISHLGPKWILKPKEGEAEKRPDFNMIRSAFSSLHYFEDDSLVVLEDWAAHSLSSTSAMLKDYIKAGVPGLKTTMLAEEPQRRRLLKSLYKMGDKEVAKEIVRLAKMPVIPFDPSSVPQRMPFDSAKYQKDYRQTLIPTVPESRANYDRWRRDYKARHRGEINRSELLRRLNETADDPDVEDLNPRRPRTSSVKKYRLTYDATTHLYSYDGE